jgi:hypothetical protein
VIARRASSGRLDGGGAAEPSAVADGAAASAEGEGVSVGVPAELLAEAGSDPVVAGAHADSTATSATTTTRGLRFILPSLGAGHDDRVTRRSSPFCDGAVIGA